MNEPEYFRNPAEFFTAVETHFAFLKKDYGFEIESTDEVGPECSIVFVNATTIVIVHYEIGGTPWIELRPRRPEAVPKGAVPRCDMMFVVEELAPTQAAMLWEGPLNGSDPVNALRALSGALREFGHDILRGDFTIFSVITERVREAGEERSRRLFRS